MKTPTKFIVRAPSNIALMKYMGKKQTTGNIPDNPSLSMTLDSLCTYLNIELQEDSHGLFRIRSGFDESKNVDHSRLQIPELKGAGIEKMEKHWKRTTDAAPSILKEAGLEVRAQGPASATIQTANTFPMGSGIASSASSFAAMTLAGLVACAADPDKLREIWNGNSQTDSQVNSQARTAQTAMKRACARISRQGSGSSCRSFEGPFVEWSEENAQAVQTAMPEMAHFVVVVSRTEKKISSSQAHQLVKTSPLWNGRVERVTERFHHLKAALAVGDISEVSRLSWTEMWEMHSLFHTATPAFTYWEPGTIHALRSFAEDVLSDNPPIITLDAGPNVHVLVPQTERAHWLKVLTERFGSEALLSDGQGRGAEILNAQKLLGPG
jgi:diphosphomevalonate decarboxylase